MPLEPLEGIRVLDLTVLPPGGYCTVQLADLGAEVVRVEPPALAGKPSLVIGEVGLSRGKRSLTLDLRDELASDVLRRLVLASDVLVENMAPGRMQARGFGYPQAVGRERGSSGARSPASGRTARTPSARGTTSRTPATPGFWPRSRASCPGIRRPCSRSRSARCLRHRGARRPRAARAHRRGLSARHQPGGRRDLAPGGQRERPHRRAAAHSRGSRPAHVRLLRRPVRECRGGGAAHLAALCRGLDVPDLEGKLGASGDEAARVRERLAKVFAQRPAAEWIDCLGPLGAAVNPVHQGRDAARGTFVEVAGSVVPANPIRVGGPDGTRAWTALDAPPRVGQHTDEVLAAAGFSPDEIRALRADGVV
jgi:crotonobetainyl-CoA:carnitine CoA-transferase CaiB-like acyl-CoA transferase